MWALSFPSFLQDLGYKFTDHFTKRSEVCLWQHFRCVHMHCTRITGSQWSMKWQHVIENLENRNYISSDKDMFRRIRKFVLINRYLSGHHKYRKFVNYCVEIPSWILTFGVWKILGHTLVIYIDKWSSVKWKFTKNSNVTTIELIHEFTMSLFSWATFLMILCCFLRKWEKPGKLQLTEKNW